MRAHLHALIGLLEGGDLEGANRLLLAEPKLQAVADYGPVLPPLDATAAEAYRKAAMGLAGRIHFLGHLAHADLAPVMAAADLSITPSVYPEAFGLVCIEGLAAGALPLASYHSGLMTPVDALAEYLHDERLRSLMPGRGFTADLADAAASMMDTYQTREASFRRQLHELAASRFSWDTMARRMLEMSGFKNHG